jgi:molecular chaperone DnaK
MSTINFGIDLGTTNSLIARSGAGEIEVFKNPVGHKETLPSAVAFRKGRIVIGDKAREYVTKDPSNVFTGFKRKMGTSERFFVPETGDFRSPADLSALVLQELKNFVYSGEQVDAAVITIPASFDTIQSNATKEAGFLAGFREVILLQEPVAASLAFANKREGAGGALQGQWLVYDLGGGTFDVALVRFEAHGMQVVDHEGDNYLGGLDFDSMIVEKIIVPYLETSGSFPDIANEIRRAGGAYGNIYFTLLHKAEEAKIALSAQQSTEIEFEIADAGGTLLDVCVPLSRAQFEACIEPQIAYSLQLVERLLAKHAGSGPVNEVILIGGSTYIPLVRNMLERRLALRVNAGIDPTTAVAVGAAYFASTRKRQGGASPKAGEPRGPLTVRTAYTRVSREQEEYFTAQMSGALPEGLFYRIRRTDGGFDSGLKPMAARISEMLPLLPRTSNAFRMSVTDAKGNPVPADIPLIEIMQGRFSIEGQPLPADICLEVDDPVNKTTRLEVIFEKNNLLPLRKTITREVTRMLKQGTEDSLIINVLEGSRYAMPASNLPIGVIEIKAAALESDIVKGSDVEIVLEINESRDLKIDATLLMNEQRFGSVFTPSVRHISLDRLKGGLKDLLWDARKALDKAEREEHYELAAQIQDIYESLQQCTSRAFRLSADDITDEKYSLEERKRALARELDALARDAGLAAVIDEYMDERDWCLNALTEDGDPQRMERYRKIVADEQAYLAAQSIYLVKAKIQELRRLGWEVRRNDPVTLISSFYYYNSLSDEHYREPHRARELLENADKAIERQNYQELLALLHQVWGLAIDNEQRETFNGTGLG